MMSPLFLMASPLKLYQSLSLVRKEFQLELCTQHLDPCWAHGVLHGWKFYRKNLEKWNSPEPCTTNSFQCEWKSQGNRKNTGLCQSPVRPEVSPRPGKHGKKASGRRPQDHRGPETVCRDSRAPGQSAQKPTKTGPRGPHEHPRARQDKPQRASLREAGSRGTGRSRASRTVLEVHRHNTTQHTNKERKADTISHHGSLLEAKIAVFPVLDVKTPPKKKTMTAYRWTGPAPRFWRRVCK